MTTTRRWRSSRAAVDSARGSRGILAWGIATFFATLLSAGAGFYLLRMLSADPGWHGIPAWLDALVTGLIVGSGTKPLHDLVTRAQLAAHRGGSWYIDRTRLRDIPLDRGPFTSSTSILSEAEAAMRVRALDVSPVIDEHGYVLGVLALTP